MQQTEATFYDYIAPSEIAPLLGLDETAFHNNLKPQIVSTGIKDLLVPLKENQMLLDVKPDLVAIADFSRAHNISGLHLFALFQDQESIANARNFAPADGIDEEVATGTSNGALLCYLKKYDQIPGREVYRIGQGESMGHLSYVYGKFANDVIWIGGAAVLVEGRERAGKPNSFVFVIKSWCAREYVKITFPEDLELATQEIRELLDGSMNEDNTKPC